MATYYPERLGLVICINHNPVFQGVWNAFKVFLHPNTQAKMQLLRKKTKYREAFFKLFDEELASWLIEEIKLNKQRPIPVSQRQFWKAPDSAGSSSVPSSPAGGKVSSSSAAASGEGVHDPRASPAYIRQYIDTFLTEIKLVTEQNCLFIYWLECFAV
jgi:CRAL/TRIO domain